MMLEADDLKKEFAKIRAVAFGKKGDKTAGRSMFIALRLSLLDDLAKHGDHRTRTLLRLVGEFLIEFQKKVSSDRK